MILTGRGTEIFIDNLSQCQFFQHGSNEIDDIEQSLRVDRPAINRQSHGFLQMKFRRKWSVLRQVHSFFQSEFSRDCQL